MLEGKKKRARTDTLMYTAYQTIKEAICTGEIRSGDLLSESQIAAGMGISRTPLREALAALENEGLVEIRRGVGAKVKPLSQRDVIYVYELRRVLEPLAAQTAVLHLTKKDLQEFRASFQGLIQYQDAPLQVQITKYAEVDWHFHMAIVEKSENPYLPKMMNLILPTIRRLQVISYRPENYSLEETVAQHMELIDALESGDIAIVCQQIRDHLTWSMNGFLNPTTEW